MSNIKINDVPQRIQYSATGGQTQFTIPFPFFSNSYVYVWLNGIQIFQGGAPGQYVVTGAGSPSGGLVTFNTAATLNDIVTIEGIMPIDRTSIYSATISNLTGSDLNGDFNREVVMLQQLNTTQSFMQLQYAPWAEISQDLTVTTDRYIPLLPPLAAWRMNEAGTEIETFQTPSGGGLAPDDATYLLQVANSNLPNAQAMGALSAGFVMNTPTTGVQFTRELEGVANQTAITNPAGVAGNPTVGIAENPTIPGTEYILFPSGTTAQRPVTPTDGMVRYNTTNQALEVYEGGSWDSLAGGIVDSVVGTANQIDVDNTDPQNPLLSLSATLDLPGTFNIQSSTAVDEIINDDTFATATATNLATALSIKNYVDSIAAGFTLINPVRVASTGNLVATYNNGASGVGATLTVTALGVASIDGVALSLNDRVLFKDQSTTYENGIYYVSDVGSGGTSAVYTRATDFDQPSEIDPGDLVPVLAGSTLAGTLWLQTATVTAVGTDPITFIQFAAAYTNVVTLTGTQTITGDKTFTGTTTLDNFVFDGNQMQHLADLNNYFEFGTDTQNFVTGGSSRMDLSDTGFRLGAANSRVTTILDEDNMASDSATALATQQSIKAYVDGIGAARIKSITIQTFSSATTTTYTAPAGLLFADVYVTAGGGGGGGAQAGAAPQAAAAGGGGAGSTSIVYGMTAATIGASQSITIGAGGNGGSAGANDGSTGGASSFGALITTNPGAGGKAGTSVSSAAAPRLGGAGGAAGSGGSININGGGGMFGLANGVSTIVCSGGGGNSFYGAGVVGVNTSAAGTAGTVYGSGGAGAAATVTTDRAGGNGAVGLIMVVEYKGV